MANESDSTLHDAFARLSGALAQLEAAAEIAAYERSQSVAQREDAQSQISASWQAHGAQLEAAMAQVQSENDFLKQDNLRLSNQLQQLQRDYLDLQQAAGSALARLDGTVKQLDLLLEH